MGEHTPTPWAYRPKEYDDWGWIRGPDGSLTAIARNSKSSDDFDEHRRAGTDPYGANAAFIVKAVNNHDALVAVQKAAYDYFMCAVQDEADDSECCITEQQHELAKALRDALAASTPDLHGEGG